MPGGEERWQVRPEGVVRVLVNGEVIVENGDAHRHASGPRAAHREQRREGRRLPRRPRAAVAIEDVASCATPGPARCAWRSAPPGSATPT